MQFRGAFQLLVVGLSRVVPGDRPHDRHGRGRGRGLRKIQVNRTNVHRSRGVELS